MKKLLTLLLACALTFAAFTFGEEAAPEDTRPLTVFFGSYEQDGDLSNGQEPIEWFIAEVRDGTAILMSKYALDWQYYDSKDYNASWSSCSLNKWLQNEFLPAAFTDEEKAQMTSPYESGELVFPETHQENLPYGEISILRKVINRAITITGIDMEENYTTYSYYLNTFVLAQPTQYCIDLGAYVNPDSGAVSWWQRGGDYYANFSGADLFRQFSKSVTRRGVRPCVYVNAEYLGLENEQE